MAEQGQAAMSKGALAVAGDNRNMDILVAAAGSKGKSRKR
jgi:hypothetical protein